MITLFFDTTSRDITPLDTSYRYRSIMGENSLTLIFEDTEFLEIPIGAYCSFEGQTYTLLKPENFKKEGSRKYIYTLILDGPQGGLRKYKMRDKVDKQLKFSLTAKPHEHLQLLVDNLNERETGWAVGDYIDAAEKVVSYNHTTLDAALQQITEAFDTEWEIVGKTIHLRKLEYNKINPLALSYGKGNGFRPGVGRANRDDANAVEILFVQGGERNISWNDYGSRELRLPKNASLIYEGRQYVTDALGMFVKRGDKALETNTEDSLDCSHIYPSRVGEVSAIEAVNPDNNAYDFLDSSIPEDLDFKDCLIPGQSLTVKFEDGVLAGREFDVDYKHDEKRFLLVAQEVDGVTMPNSTFKPAVGDKYAVFGMMMPDQYISDDTTETGASWDMFREAVKYLYEHENPRFSFTGELDGIWSKQNWLNVGGKIVLGGYVNFSDPDFQPDGIDIRIVGVRDAVNNPYSPVIELSNAPAGVSVASELKKIKQNEVVVDDKVGEVYSYAKRRYRETMETVEMLEGAVSGFSDGVSPLSVQTMSLIVGSEALQFRFVNSKTDPAEILHEVTFDPTNKIMSAPGGIIQHMTIGISTLKAGVHETTEYSFWDVDPFDSPPLTDPAKKYYVYVKASKTETTAVFYLSETPIKMNDIAGYYHFLLGFLNSASNGERSFARMHGFTEILPGRITTSKIHADTVEATQVLAESIYATGARINGNLVVDKSITAETIDVTGLFAEKITATDFDLTAGKVGNFRVSNKIESLDAAGERITLDPDSKSIDIESTQEGGMASVRLRVGDLTGIGELNSSTGEKFYNDQDSAPASHFVSGTEIAGMKTFSTSYIGKDSLTANLGKIKTSSLTSSEEISVTPDRNYVSRLNFLFAIKHNENSSNGKLHKLLGTATVNITAVLKGKTAAGTIRNISVKTDTIHISRSDNSIMYDEYPLSFRTAFNSKDGGYEYEKVYWTIEGNISGNLKYQERDDNWIGEEWWSDRPSWDIEFQMKMGANSDIQPSIGITEITTSGFQTYWAQNSYFRVDGKDSDALIRSAGKWEHNGVSIATIDDVTEATPDLTPYVRWYDLEQSYHNKEYINTNFANKSGDATQDFNVKDLFIHGTVNHWLGETLTVSDANLQLNAKQSGARVDSGLIINDNDTATELSRLYYATDNSWKIDDNKIVTDNLPFFRYDVNGNHAPFKGGAIANTLQSTLSSFYIGYNSGAGWLKLRSGYSDNSDLLDGLNSSQFLRSDVADTMNAQLNFNSFVRLASRLGIHGNYNSTQVQGIWSIDTGYKVDLTANDFGNQYGIVYAYESAGTGEKKPLAGYGHQILFTSNGVRKAAISLTEGHGWFDGNLEVNKNSKFGLDLESQQTFISGFAGQGWKLDKSEDHLTVDRLTVRGRMDVYELVINKIRAQNGSYWFTDSAKVVSVSEDATYYYLNFDDDDGNSSQPFWPNDIIKAQKFTGRDVRVVTGTLTSNSSYVTSNQVRLVKSTTTGVPAAGDEFVRIGNSVDTNRQGAIYLTSSDSGSPYIDVLDGVNSASFAGKNKLRIGKLDGISGQNGYGIWGSRNGNDTDFVISSDGYAKIAGWNFDKNYLWAGSKYGSATPGIELRSDGYNRLLVHNGTTSNYINIYSYPSGDWGILGKSNNTNVFQLGSTNQIAGVNFDDEKLYTTKWSLNKDGSFQFGGGKITGYANGNMTIDGTLVNNLIQSSDWISSGGTKGTKLDLSQGKMNFGEIISIDAANGGVINVIDPGASKVSARIGHFNLTPTNAGTGDSYPTSSGTMSSKMDDSTSFGGVTTQTFWLDYASGIGTGIWYTFYKSAASLSTGTYKITLPVSITLGNSYSATSTYFKYEGVTNYAKSWPIYEKRLKVKAILEIGGVVVYEQTIIDYSNYDDSPTKTLSGNINTTVTGTGMLSVKLVVEGVNAVEDLYTSNEYDYTTRTYHVGGNSINAQSPTGIEITPISSITELSTKGIQSLWAPEKYFRVDGNASWFTDIRGKVALRSPDNKHTLLISDDGIKTYNAVTGQWKTID